MSLTPLPGVRLWLRRLLADLRAGRSCLWLLPRAHTGGPGCPADTLLDELLHELGDFLLLPPADLDRTVTSLPPPSALSPAPRWSGLAPLLDYDDGLSDFGFPARDRAPTEPEVPATAPASPAESLAELLERLAKELPAAPGQSDPGSDVSDGADSPTAQDTTGDVLARLTGGADGHPETRPITVRAWCEPAPTAATHMLRRLVATAKEAGLPPAQRPRALVIATAEDLPTDLPDQLAREDIAVHWWWGAMGRLDTETVVALTRPPVSRTANRHQLIEAVARATVTEVCGPFLEVAAALADRWDGRPETLLDELSHAVVGTSLTDTPPPGRDQTRGSVHRPDQLLLAAWSTGTVDSWDGRLRHHPRHDLAHEHVVATRIWLAQNHALLPLLDDAREDFTATVRQRTRVPLSQLADRYGPRPVGSSGDPAPGNGTAYALAALELGAMWGAHLNGDIALTRPERERLRTFWDARNRLAHRTPLDESRLQRLVTELCR
jgi:hypothetical protein